MELSYLPEIVTKYEAKSSAKELHLITTALIELVAENYIAGIDLIIKIKAIKIKDNLGFNVIKGAMIDGTLIRDF